jgi:CO/xanthine dehydrogenase FAD-binding subunit
MLLNLREYQRPASGSTSAEQREALERALALLARRDTLTVPLAGGDSLVASADRDIEAVVDLQALGLDSILLEPAADGIPTSPPRLAIGAMVTRTALAASEAVTGVFDGILAEGARRWSGSIQRNRATAGGAVAVAATNDPLVAALLACDAVVLLFGATGFREESLYDFLPRRAEALGAPALITGLRIPSLAPALRAHSGAALAAVARTPADAPIVLAVAHLTAEKGRCISARLVAGGAGPTPLRLPEVEGLLTGQALDEDTISAAAARAAQLVQPIGDFRGSAEYRRAMVAVLSERALHEAWVRAA